MAIKKAIQSNSWVTKKKSKTSLLKSLGRSSGSRKNYSGTASQPRKQEATHPNRRRHPHKHTRPTRANPTLHSKGAPRPAPTRRNVQHARSIHLSFHHFIYMMRYTAVPLPHRLPRPAANVVERSPRPLHHPVRAGAAHPGQAVIGLDLVQRQG